MPRVVSAVFGLLLLAMLASSTLYVVDQRQYAIVFALGEVKEVINQPGLHFKLPPPFQNVTFYEKRIMTIDTPDSDRFITSEKKNLVVDSFVKWRIEDALKYFLTVGGQESDARRRLEQVVNSGLRDEFGKREVKKVISVDRHKIMEILTENTDREARKFGIVVVDVRIQRVDLPDEVSQSVYQRMKAERSRIANELRAQGAEAAEKIRANSERQREVLLAEAYGKAERVRGEGDAKATALYGQAYGRAPEFYSLYRSLGAYKESFRSKEDIMIVDPSSDFFKYMKKPSR